MTLENPLDCKEIQPVHPKGDQFWVFIGRTDVEAETPILWPSDAKSWLIWRDPDTGVGDGQGGLACCDSWGRKESDTTERLNWTELILGKSEGRRRRGQQRMRWLDGITDSMDMIVGKLQGLDREAWRAVIHGVTKSRTRLSDWTELNWAYGGKFPCCFWLLEFMHIH